MLTKPLVNRTPTERTELSIGSRSLSTTSPISDDENRDTGNYVFELEMFGLPQYVRDDYNFLIEIQDMIFQDWNPKDQTIKEDRVVFYMDKPVFLTDIHNINLHIRDIFEALQEDGEEETIPYVRAMSLSTKKIQSVNFGSSPISTAAKVSNFSKTKSPYEESKYSLTNTNTFKRSRDNNESRVSLDESDYDRPCPRTISISCGSPVSSLSNEMLDCQNDTQPSVIDHAPVAVYKSNWVAPISWTPNLSATSPPHLANYLNTPQKQKEGGIKVSSNLLGDLNYLESCRPIPEHTNIEKIIYPKITLQPLRYHYKTFSIIKFVLMVLAGLVMLPILFFLDLCPKGASKFYVEPMRKINETLIGLPRSTRRSLYIEKIKGHFKLRFLLGTVYFVIWLAGFSYGIWCCLFLHGDYIWIENVRPCAYCVVDALFPLWLFMSSWGMVSFWVAFSKTIENNPGLSELKGVKLFVRVDGFKIASFDAYTFLKKRALRHQKQKLIDKRRTRKRFCRRIRLSFIYTRWLAALLALFFASIPLIMRVVGFHPSASANLLVSIGVVWSVVNMYVVSSFIVSAKSKLMFLLLEWTKDITALLSAQYSKKRKLHWVILNSRENIIAWSELQSLVYKKTLVEIYRVEVLLVALALLAMFLLTSLFVILLHPSQVGWLTGLSVPIPWSDCHSNIKCLKEHWIFYALVCQIVFVIIATLHFPIQFLVHAHVLNRLWKRQSKELIKQRFIILQASGLKPDYLRKTSWVNDDVMKCFATSATIAPYSDRVSINGKNREASSFASFTHIDDTNHSCLVPSNLLGALIELHKETPKSVYIWCIDTTNQVGYKIVFLVILIFLPSILFSFIT